MRESIGKISSLMATKYLIDISIYDNSFLERTLINRMTETSCKDISAYFLRLNEDVMESNALSDSLNNSFSEFFRNPLTFTMLEQDVLPKLFKMKKETKAGDIRIWSAGCASGQEPYSLAILAEEYKALNQHDINLRIFATDRNNKEIQSSIKGIYHLRTLHNTRLYHINKYFSNSGEFYSINPEIKKLINFSVFDLLDMDAVAPPASIYGDFDIVMCSNLLFYYKPEIQKAILKRLSSSVVKGGFFVTGEAEVGIVKSHKCFKQYAAPAAIFVKT